MRSSRSVLVLGGGVGGVVAASHLRRLLRPDDRVLLIEREQHHLFQPSLLWLAVGKRKPEQIQRPLERLRRKGIDVVTGEISEIEPAARRVRVNGIDFSGDAIVVSLGAELAPQRVPGLVGAGHNLYTLAGARSARDSMRTFRSGKVVVLTAAPAYKCPAAPYEAAMLVKHALRGRGAAVEMRTAEPGPMGTAGPEVSAAVRGMVEAQGISYHPNNQIEEVDGSRNTLRFKDGSTTAYDLLLYVPPHEAPAVIRESGLGGESGWISVDRETLATDMPGVYAIGDVTSITLASGKPLPKAGVFAHEQAKVVAGEIAANWNGTPRPEPFDGKGACFIETGAGRAGYGSGQFYAEPVPYMRLHQPSRLWHLGKVLYEKRWLSKWF